ncbi:zinc ribbon domain-containing protein [Hydrogenophaga sp. NH-16]|uniref:zinc ribbon domain-containing protein n=1 Tax=Hydrogenophaga sp. NH-16 TaxID=2184519 RepID=UPI000FDB4EC1|nr:zinc ribbon domain-containing protein [Hydrogenophaga sp. NH-16]
MAIVCPSCGKENRDQARFCRGCARPLDRPGGDAGSDAVARERASRALRRARRRKRSGQRTEQQPAWWRWAGAMTAGVLVLAIGWWLGAHQSTPAPVQAAPLAGAPVASPSATPTAGTAAPATAPQTATEPVGADAASPNTPEAAAAVDRLRHSVELLEQQDRERAAAQEQQRQKLALEQKRLEDARRRAGATPAVASTHSGASEPAPVAAPAPAESAPVAAAAAPPPPATRSVAGVDQACAGSDNVFARDFCRIRECGKAVFANDPVCVRFRQMDEARRREAEYR